ncbi:MAG: DUF5716 family protein [Lachnospiraceae bacterium]|nr:DUF5716 family protein [Lachnospiraceae bacterium]
MDVKRMIIGIDLNRSGSQVCCYDRSLGDAVSIPVKAGSDQLTFPTLLCLVPADHSWYHGIEARYFAEKKNGILIDQLYDLCADGTSAWIEGKEYAGADLLAVFLRKTLEAAGAENPASQVAGIVITVPKLTRFFVRAIRQAYEVLGIPRNRGFLQDYKESFFVHTLFQSQDVWARKTGLFEFRNGQVHFSCLEMNFRTKPVAAYVNDGGSISLKGNDEQKDRMLVSFIRESLGEDLYSGIFLMGEEFDQRWAKESIRLLCKGARKVFGGNNLYAKGAALSAREKTEPGHLKSFLYVGSDLVRHNVSMELMVQGIAAVYPLISAGVNWYETAADFEILLDQGEELTFLVSRMNEKSRKKLVMPLPGLPSRPAGTTRLKVHMEYEAAGKCRITAEDLGFGEMFPASGKIWNEVMEDQN